MEKKNKKLLLIVGILLLLAGISYAYFTGVSTFNGSGDKVEGITATVKGSEVVISGNLEFNDLDILPGHKNISSIKLTATGNAELLPYNLIWNGSNGLNTPLNYTVYKTGEKIETTANCEKKQETLGADKIYYEECSITNLEKLGTKISEGTIKANTTNTKEILAENEFITATSEGTSIYYYVILEYPNLDEEQNADIGGSFKGTVTVEESEAKPDINILAVKIEQEDGTYQDSDDIPQNGYIVNTEKSLCSNGATPTGFTPNITVNNLTKNGTSCYLYFDKVTAKEAILANVIVKNGIPNFSKAATNDEGVYISEKSNNAGDIDGDTYYFRGAVENNYVKFAGYYWRIIRINGDETVRMIYDGTSVHNNGIYMSDGIAIKKAKFSHKDAYNNSTDNAYINDNAYVGFKYTLGEVHGLGTKSNVLQELEMWYQGNLIEYADKIDKNAGFCGDRTPSTTSSSINNQGGTGTTTTWYGAEIRLGIGKSPSLKCSNEDLYTVNDAIKKDGTPNGNRSLDYPIGLISADEVAIAGASAAEQNKTYYLYTGQHYWTMSPDRYNGVAAILAASGSGSFVSTSVASEYDIRPVINLKANTEFIFTGTGVKGSPTNPYIVAGAE